MAIVYICTTSPRAKLTWTDMLLHRGIIQRAEDLSLSLPSPPLAERQVKRPIEVLVLLKEKREAFYYIYVVDLIGTHPGPARNARLQFAICVPKPTREGRDKLGLSSPQTTLPTRALSATHHRLRRMHQCLYCSSLLG